MSAGMEFDGSMRWLQSPVQVQGAESTKVPGVVQPGVIEDNEKMKILASGGESHNTSEDIGVLGYHDIGVDREQDVAFAEPGSLQTGTGLATLVDSVFGLQMPEPQPLPAVLRDEASGLLIDLEPPIDRMHESYSLHLLAVAALENATYLSEFGAGSDLAAILAGAQGPPGRPPLPRENRDPTMMEELNWATNKSWDVEYLKHLLNKLLTYCFRGLTCVEPEYMKHYLNYLASPQIQHGYLSDKNRTLTKMHGDYPVEIKLGAQTDVVHEAKPGTFTFVFGEPNTNPGPDTGLRFPLSVSGDLSENSGGVIIGVAGNGVADHFPGGGGQRRPCNGGDVEASGPRAFGIAGRGSDAGRRNERGGNGGSANGSYAGNVRGGDAGKDGEGVTKHAKGGDGENRLWAKDVKAAEEAGHPRAEGGNGNDAQQPGGSARITPIGEEIKRPIIVPPVLNRGGVWP